MANKLTIRREKFVQGLFAGMTQSEAYKQAFSAEKMSENAIAVEACNLANSPKVSLRLEELTTELKMRNMATVEKTLAELAKIGFSNIGEYLKVDDYQVEVGFDGDGQPITRTVRDVEIFRTGDIPKEQLAAVAEIRRTRDGISLKLHDKVKALEDIARHLGMFSDKLEITGKDGGPMQLETLTTDELQKRIEVLMVKREGSE